MFYTLGVSLMAKRDWYTVKESADITGYSTDHIRRLAREAHNATDNPKITVAKTPNGFLIWLPSLVDYRATKKDP